MFYNVLRKCVYFNSFICNICMYTKILTQLSISNQQYYQLKNTNLNTNTNFKFYNCFGIT